MENIIFDLDGTLWDARKSIIDSWNVVLEKNGYNKISIEELTPLIGLSQTEIIENLYNTEKKETIELIKLLSHGELEYLKKHGGILYKNVKECLNLLKNKFNLFIVSNCQEGYIDVFLEYYQFQDIFKDFESAGRTKLSKSKNIEEIINRNNITNAVYVGDTHQDFISADINNIPFIYAEYGFGEVNDFNFSIKEFKELPIILNTLL